MRRVRRFSTAVVVAAVVASGMLLATTGVEAKGKKPGGQDAVCAYLLNVINYEYVNDYIKLWATSLYKTLGCEPALP